MKKGEKDLVSEKRNNFFFSFNFCQFFFLSGKHSWSSLE